MPFKPIVLLILVFTLIRLAVAPWFGLGVDEAHYVLYAYHLDLSYVDHPPLVGWVQALFLNIFGDSTLSVRLSAILLMAYVSWECYRFLRQIGTGEREALWGVAALNGSFMFGAIGLMLLPENLLLVFVFPLMRSVLRIEQNKSLKEYLWLGIWLGLLGLSKYTAVLLILPLLVYLLIKRRFDLFFSPYILFTALIGLVMISPVLYWNYTHEWVSFTYQSAHVVGNTSIDLKSFARSLVAQFGAYSPFLFPIAFYGAYRSLRSHDNALFLAALVGITIELFFLGTSLLKPVLPHWPALFYLLFIPTGTAFLLNSGAKKAKIARFSVGLTLMLSLLVHAELACKIGAFPDYKSPFRDIYGYPAVLKNGNDLLSELNATKKGIAVTNWTYGSRLGYYARPYGVQTFVLQDYNRQFALWENEKPLGYDLIVIQSHFSGSDELKSLRCDSMAPLKSIDLILEGHKVDTITYYSCTNYRGIQ